MLAHHPELSALMVAWRVCMTAVSLFTAALALAPYWDAAVCAKALHDALMATPM
jgi:hypothetical protein